MIGIIVAMSPERVIGLDGKIPWHYPADLKRFKELTTGTTVIMGRLTYESVGRPLPNRRNIVISRTNVEKEGIETFKTIDDALATCEGDVWFIGGARIYGEAMAHADVIDVTLVPDHVPDSLPDSLPEGVRFPAIDEAQFECGEVVAFEGDPRLRRCVYTRRRS